jgi:hypothetical protein
MEYGLSYRCSQYSFMAINGIPSDMNVNKRTEC